MISKIYEFMIYLSTVYSMRYLKWIFPTIMLAYLFIYICSVIFIYPEVSADISYKLNTKECMVYILSGFKMDQLEGISLTFMLLYIFLKYFHVTTCCLFSFSRHSMLNFLNVKIIYLSTVFTANSVDWIFPTIMLAWFVIPVTSIHNFSSFELYPEFNVILSHWKYHLYIH